MDPIQAKHKLTQKVKARLSTLSPPSALPALSVSTRVSASGSKRPVHYADILQTTLTEGGRKEKKEHCLEAEDRASEKLVAVVEELKEKIPGLSVKYDLSSVVRDGKERVLLRCNLVLSPQ